jgi:uncharacterized membrane protein
MAAAAFAPLFILVLASVELAIVGSMITRLLAQQASNRFENDAVMPIGLVVTIFGLAMIVAVRAGSRIASGIRLPGRMMDAPRTEISMPHTDMPAYREEAGAMPGAARLSHSLERAARLEARGANAAAGASSHSNFNNGLGSANARRDTPASQDLFASRSRSAALPHPRRRTRSAARRDA